MQVSENSSCFVIFVVDWVPIQGQGATLWTACLSFYKHTGLSIIHVDNTIICGCHGYQQHQIGEITL